MSDDATDLKARLAALEEKFKIQDQIGRLEKRLTDGPSPGSPAAIPARRVPYLIAPHSGPSQIETLRQQFVRLGQYEKL